MLAGKMKQKYRSMDTLCRSTWTGAHEIFQAEEYDAGASLTHQASQRVEQKRQLDSAYKFWNALEVVASPFNEVDHKE